MNDAQNSNPGKDGDGAETSPARPRSPRVLYAFRRLLFGTNTLVALLLAAALVAMLNYLAARHHLRADISRARPYEFSDKTRRLLAGISNRVDVTLFFRPSHALYEDAASLLREYESACKWIRVEHADPDREQARAAQLVKKYGLARPNVLIFSSGGVDSLVLDEDLAEFDLAGAKAGAPPRRTGFRGEQAFSTALLHVTQPREPVVYFLLGHGERDPRDHDQYSGYSTIGRLLAADRIQARTLSLVTSNAIPADADALVIAGPQNKFLPAESDALRRYLARSGRLLLALDPATDGGLGALLEEWGVRIGSGVVVDTARSLTTPELFITAYGNHPISAAISNSTVVLAPPRPLEAVAATGADKPRVSPLLYSSRASWAETDGDRRAVRFDSDRDRMGPLAVALAVEKGGATSVEVDIRPTRIVVIGDVQFAANGALVGANPDLFLNSLNWLIERPDLLSIAAKPVTLVRLVMDGRQLSILFAVVVVAFPAAAALGGCLVWLRRRR